MLEGAFPWPGDPFFRPTVGLYVDGRLTRLAGTVRRRAPAASGGTDWQCHYRIEQGPTPPGQTVSVFCLETGDRLWPSPAGHADGTSPTVSIDMLLLQAQRSRPAWDTSGFVFFLALPVADQVALLYTDLLARNPDPEGFEDACTDVIAGRRTILDVRDKVFESAEFSKRVRSCDERVGHWMAWGGLRTAEGLLASMPLAAASPVAALTPEQRSASIAFERPFRSVEEARAYLCRLALGTRAGEADIRAWLDDHAGPIDRAMETLFAPGFAADRAKSGQTDRAPVLLKRMLSSMKPGSAGRRTGSAVHTIDGRAGTVCSGPGLQTRSGRFTLRVNVTPKNTRPGTGQGHFWLKVSYGDTLLAERRVEGFSGSPRVVELDYVISDRLAAILSKPLLEFTVAADGSFGFSITGMELLDGGCALAESAGTPPANDWSARLRIGAAGEGSPGAVAASKPGVSGHLFFGPYVHFFPGRYELVVSALVRTKRFLRDHATLEVAAGEEILAAADIRLVAGPNRWRLAFDVNRIPSFESSQNLIEFRLHVSGRSDVIIEQVSSRPLEGGAASAPADRSPYPGRN